MSDFSTYLLHGLRVRSEVALDAPLVPGPADLEIRWGERRAVPDAVPPGELLARVALPGAGFSLTARPGGYLLRVDGWCELALDATRRRATVHVMPEAQQEGASLLIGGFLAVILALDGRCVLHASAIETGGRAVAFIGESGMGKTTVAALCCVAGARLVTDDVLRVETRQGKGWCFSGSSELRLRPAAEELAQLLDPSRRRSTLDARAAVRPAPADPVPLPLAALVAPCPTHGADELAIERLRGSAAMLELVRFPRTIGWMNATKAARDFDVLARLAESVPVYRAHLPWGPPFRPDLGRELLEQIELDESTLPRER